ncbi:NUDIX hydrolase [Actinomadura craniellae]|uniref:NUDIX hydrolase n=1 Tax=Actinomadura craniellae TaxID=2231787 RepID=A0A365H2K2_9ACTN|nr:NUDIX domain-containing protein [Actinomadura craniellae]RAY13279.1 NUDIX hydrolase [Actinomadura craniellae]
MRVRCVGAIIRDSGRLLLIRRGRPPGAGLWSLPGGRVEPGESDVAAVVREVREETGLLVRPGRLVGTVERPGPGNVIYEIFDYAAVVDPAGPVVPRAGDDAADARWAGPGELLSLQLTSGLLDVLAEWDIWDADCYRLFDD